MGMSSYMRKLRAVWGSGRLLVPSVSGIVRDSGGRVLLVQQRDDGVWSTPGGAIEFDETPANAVVREVREETGLVVVPRRLFGVFGGPTFVVRYPNGDETQYVSSMFECDVVSGDLRADGDETQAAEFWSEAEASRLSLAPWLTGILPRLFEQRSDAWFESPSQSEPDIG
jgi:ADP-ribose pyrophosphatase YjhB (NUDIX family)